MTKFKNQFMKKKLTTNMIMNEIEYIQIYLRAWVNHHLEDIEAINNPIPQFIQQKGELLDCVYLLEQLEESGITQKLLDTNNTIGNIFGKFTSALETAFEVAISAQSASKQTK